MPKTGKYQPVDVRPEAGRRRHWTQLRTETDKWRPGTDLCKMMYITPDAAKPAFRKKYIPILRIPARGGRFRQDPKY